MKHSTIHTHEGSYEAYPEFLENSNGNLELRVALDVGSGGTKASAGIYDNFKKDYVLQLGNQKKAVGYQKHVSESVDGSLSSEFMNQGLHSLFEIIDSYKIAGIENIKVSGIATAWARNASNTDEYLGILNNNGICIRVASQIEEGELGYKAATYLSADTKNVGVFDIGGGSFQIIHKEDDYLKVLEGPYGASNFANDVKEYLSWEKDSDFFFDDTDVKVALDFAKEKLSKVLDKQSFETVEGIGGFLNFSIKPLVGSDSVTREDLDNIISIFNGLSKSEAMEIFPHLTDKFVGYVQTNLILLDAIMETAGINEIHFNTNTTAEYILHTEEFWQDLEVLVEGFDDALPMLMCENI